MSWVHDHIKWIMLICGLMTLTMLYTAIAPQAALLTTFGETLEGPLADIVVRNFGVLVALIGAMLVYGAFNPATRSLVVVVAGVSKLVFIALVLSHGSRYLGERAAISIVVDSLMIVLFAVYLLSLRRKAAA